MTQEASCLLFPQFTCWAFPGRIGSWNAGNDDSPNATDDAADEIMDRIVKSATQVPSQRAVPRERKRSRANRKSCEYKAIKLLKIRKHANICVYWCRIQAFGRQTCTGSGLSVWWWLAYVPVAVVWTMLYAVGDSVFYRTWNVLRRKKRMVYGALCQYLCITREVRSGPQMETA